jgi:hypothetical protein
MTIQLLRQLLIALAEGYGKWNRHSRMYKRKRVTLYGGMFWMKKNETVIKEKGENVEYEITIEVQNEMRGKGEEKKNDRQSRRKAE